MNARRLGFTLVEMLVVLGIIGLLAAVLLPTLTAARRSATSTKCLNNLRQVGMAMAIYMNENAQTLPLAVTSNSYDDPISQRGLDERHIPGTGMLPVAYYLDSYLKRDLRVWACPAAKVVRTEADQSLRAPQVIMPTAAHPSRDKADEWFRAQQWRPGYLFLSAHGWEWYLKSKVAKWDWYGMGEWKVRNVSGLNVDQLRTVTGQSGSEIVLFLDYSSMFHSKGADDVFDLQQKNTNQDGMNPSDVVRGKFQSNVLYLDGHADTKRYEWQGGLVNLLHRPIRQRWDESGEGDYTQLYPQNYKSHYPD